MAPAQQQPDFSLAFVSLSDLKAAGAPSVAVAPTPRPVLVDQWTKSVEYSVLLKQNGWQGWNYSSTGRHPEIEWVQAHTQPSSEYRQLCEKAFRIGWDAVAKAVKSRPGRLAVVLDIDETVMINATFQRELGDGPFDPKKWEEWVRRKEAAAVPGAKEFLDKARGVGMRVVFMSDRSSDLDAFTVENLKKHGLFVEGDVVLSKTSKTDTKDVRRSCVSAGTTGADARCKTFEPMTIIATFGDSLRDHVEVYGLEAARRTLGDYNWGKTRFVLPNPMYGQWATDYK
jgi:5'-nucleotidase (lipoprotein e(P4) family)